MLVFKMNGRNHALLTRWYENGCMIIIFLCMMHVVVDVLRQIPKTSPFSARRWRETLLNELSRLLKQYHKKCSLFLYCHLRMQNGIDKSMTQNGTQVGDWMMDVSLITIDILAKLSYGRWREARCVVKFFYTYMPLIHFQYTRIIVTQYISAS